MGEESAVRPISVSYDTEPTSDQFAAFQNMFGYFNFKLFGGKLPNIILNFSRKNKRVGGFFAPERWEHKAGKVHEISLNPDQSKTDDKDLVSTLVHEMAHLWQQVFGKPPRSGYHNKEWGNKMKEIGLYPSNTSAVGGKETGQQMSHYIVPSGRFDIAYESMPKEYLLPFQFAIPPVRLIVRKNKTKYMCPSCDAKIWGKPDMEVSCNKCSEQFEEQ